MLKSETKARAGAEPPSAGDPAAEVKSALAGFMGDIIERLEKLKDWKNRKSD